MEIKELKKILEKHRFWLNNDDGEKADLYGADLYGADLYGADLREADLCGADLRGANLREADLREADLCGANLCGANLSNSKGLIKPSEFLNRLEKNEVGIIVYKTFGENYEPNKKWIIEPESTIEEVCNFDRTNTCACGINVATKEWILSETKGEVWKCLIKWEWMVDVCVPYNTDGKFRCEKLQLLKVVSREELE